MQDQTRRLPVPKEAIPAFTPVPRKSPRHDGWTPERQRAFVEALADTGCVSIAARMVNMSQASFYQLRRQPGAESFRAAADAAQNLGLQVVKDEAFDRAMNGELVPVFVGGKLMGFRRRKNDRLLMFILRHYGQDAAGRRTTINYFSTRATAGAASSPSSLGEGDRSPQACGGGAGAAAVGASAEASGTTVRTVMTGSPGRRTTAAREDDAAALIDAFQGLDLDPAAQAEILQSLAACAERRRAAEQDPAIDPARHFIGEAETNGYLGTLESGFESGDFVPFAEGEQSWESLGEGGSAAEVHRVVGEMQARLAAETPEHRAAREAAEDAMSREAFARANGPLPGCPGGGNPALPAPEPGADDPRLDWRNWTGGVYADPSDPPRPGEGAQPRTRSRDAGAADAPAAERLPGPAPDLPAANPGAPKRAYKKRTPKPRFTAPDEASKAEAAAAVAADRREAAEAEAERRRRRAAARTC